MPNGYFDRTIRIATLAGLFSGVQGILMSRVPTLSAVIAAILGGVTTGAAFAQTASTGTSDEPLATIVVTGSNIKRHDNEEGPNPIQIISREELESSAKVTVAD